MTIEVKEDRSIKKLYSGKEGTQNEDNITTLVFIIPEKYSNFDKKLVFISKENNFTKDLINNSYTIDTDVSQYKRIECYLMMTDNNTKEEFRSKVFELKFYESQESEGEYEYNS
ncbi:MAG: hypothetical protein IJH55_07610 [Romboutsia sp.]|nr:hypothetical protein [Romboutsia sp.]